MQWKRERKEKRDLCFHIRYTHTHTHTHTHADTQHLIRGRHTQSTKRCQMKLPVFSHFSAAAGILRGYIFILRWKKDKILPSCVYNNRDDGDHKSSSRNGGAISKRRIDANHFNSPKNTKKERKKLLLLLEKHSKSLFFLFFFSFFGMGRGTGCCISTSLQQSEFYMVVVVTIYCWIHIGRAR